MPSKPWTSEERAQLAALYHTGAKDWKIAKALNRSIASVQNEIYDQRKSGVIRKVVSQPRTAIHNEVLTIEGDALILPDVETPYHHSDFINRCIDLALRWNVPQCILAGDFVHFANYSQWGENFQPEAPQEITDPETLRLIAMLPATEREGARRHFLETMRPALADENISAELASVRLTAREISGAFDNVYYIMGNHEQRKLRVTEMGEPVSELLKNIGAGDNWKATSNYHCNLITDSPVPFRVTHPRGAGQKMAIDLSIQFHCHVIMGHSHRWAVQRDPSGDYWAIQAGHTVDELRLAYVMQRDTKRDAHALGAVIVRGGYPFVLCESFPFGSL